MTTLDAAPMLAEGLQSFRPFGWMHLAASGSCFLLMAMGVWLGRRWRAREETVNRERRVRFALAWLMLAYQAGQQAWYFTPRNFDWAVSLPLHVCDLAAWSAPIMLMTRVRWLRAMMYFWGIGLSTQAFFTPILRVGPAHPEFWFFWVGHLVIVGSAVYDCAALGFRPRARDFVTALTLTLIYIGVAMGVNAVLSDHFANYAFVANTKPTNPTLIDRLGDWPMRVVWLCLIGTIGFAGLWLVWPASAWLARRLGRNSEAARTAQDAG